MLSSFNIAHRPTRTRQRHLRAGFTFVEVLTGVAILGLTASAFIFGLNQLNSHATVNRLYTAAQTLAQNQIDLILTKGPFDPFAVPPLYPSPNLLGTDATDLDNGKTYTYYSNPTTGTINVVNSSNPTPATSDNITIYNDPMNPSSSIVQGTVQTKVKLAPHTVTVTNADGSTTTTDLKIRKATVTVAYRYRNRNYSVVMDTMRTSD
jgi:prepilin-type N-terminal cleavage/methylation domain-containing protein